MPKRIIPITDKQVSTSKHREKDYKISDGGGLHLLVTSSGGKLWRFQYRFNNKQKLLALGAYPAITLADARKRRDDARKLLANNVDPAAVKKAMQEAVVASSTNSFEIIAREWYAKNILVWSAGHAETVKSRLERDVFPQIGSKPVAEITAAETRNMLLKIEARGAVDTALRIKIICGQVFRYAIATGRLEHDPSASLKPREIFLKREAKHHAAITDPKELAPLLTAIEAYHGSIIVKSALMLTPMLFVRPGELQKMEWSEINLDEAIWSIPAAKMKTRQPHIVPLAKQAISILLELRPLTGFGQYVFPGRTSSRPMSNNSINAALRYLGYDGKTVTGHGFRATARTILDEVLHQRIDFIEHQLAHAVRDPNGRAYNRTAHLEERRKMMQLWSDYLDELKLGARSV